jgi:protein-S-isoprenylcysteine O-methyltransferase Ste14
LDAGRFGWTQVPLSVHVAGWAGLAVAFLFASWAMLSNTYASRTVRIQSDRGHQVVTAGPYRYVRHPMYVGVILSVMSIPLILRSWWAIIPAVLIVILFFIRTGLEDRTLKKKLTGYKEYAERVRYRILPGVW